MPAVSYTETRMLQLGCSATDMFTFLGSWVPITLPLSPKKSYLCCQGPLNSLVQGPECMYHVQCNSTLWDRFANRVLRRVLGPYSGNAGLLHAQTSPTSGKQVSSCSIVWTGRGLFQICKIDCLPTEDSRRNPSQKTTQGPQSTHVCVCIRICIHVYI